MGMIKKAIYDIEEAFMILPTGRCQGAIETLDQQTTLARARLQLRFGRLTGRSLSALIGFGDGCGK